MLEDFLKNYTKISLLKILLKFNFTKFFHKTFYQSRKIFLLKRKKKLRKIIFSRNKKKIIEKFIKIFC